MKQMAQEGGRSAWLKHVMSVKKAHPSMSLGDAMKAAKKTYKKGGALSMPPMGGRRRKTAKVGGTAYGFTGGPYTGSQLSDGNGRFPAMADATWKGPSELLGGRRRHRGGNYAASTDGNPAQVPYTHPSTAPETAVGVNGTFTSSGSLPAPFSKGGRRRQTKKAGRRRRHVGGDNTVGSAMVYGASASEAHKAAAAAAAARNGEGPASGGRRRHSKKAGRRRHRGGAPVATPVTTTTGTTAVGGPVGMPATAMSPKTAVLQPTITTTIS